MPQSPSTAPRARFDPLCLILAWIWPGLGHIWSRQPRRGVLIMAGVLGMFLFGLLVGGVDVVDREEDALWFVPQAFAGVVAFAADYLNVTFVKTGRIGMPSLGRVNEMGTLFTALAGLMNLAVMIDATTRTPPRDMDRREGERHEDPKTPDLSGRGDGPGHSRAGSPPSGGGSANPERHEMNPPTLDARLRGHDENETRSPNHQITLTEGARSQS